MTGSALSKKMRFTVIGAGPAGLFFAYLMKRSRPQAIVQVVEQNPPDVTFGFGVVLSGRALNFLAEADPAAVSRLSARMEHWSEQHIVLRDARISVDASSYSAIERIVLLEELQSLCRGVGVDIQFGRRIQQLVGLDGDVIVGADGANSMVRDSCTEAFGTRGFELENYFAWYGVERAYPAHTLTFLQTAAGAFCGHHYRYKPAMSTFVAEVDRQTWFRSGMAEMSDDERREFVSCTFSETLGGFPLVSNRSVWKRWRLVKNDHWHHRNIVLIGDALRTAHPSIGSGTRLAMEDAIALWRAFEADGADVAAAFARFERERRPTRDRLNRAAELSIAWYEAMAKKMDLAPYDFAYDYLLRTGIMTHERLVRESPDFVARYQAARSAAAVPATISS